MYASFDHVRKIVPETSTAFIVPAPVGYQGPGDIVSGAIAWWGLRAYSNATCGTNCCDIKRASDGATQTFTTLSDGSLDIASITTFLASTTGKITKLYDQSGANACSGPADVSDVTGVDFAFNAIGSLPGISGTGSGFRLRSNNLAASYPQPFTISCVALRTIGTGAASITDYDDNPTNVSFLAAANAIGMYNGGSASISVAAADGSAHAIQAKFQSTTSVLYIDGSSNAEDVGDTNPLASGQIFEFPGIQAGSLTGYLWEAGFWPTGFSGTQNANMNSNQRTYWGF